MRATFQSEDVVYGCWTGDAEIARLGGLGCTDGAFFERLGCCGVEKGVGGREDGQENGARWVVHGHGESGLRTDFHASGICAF